MTCRMFCIPELCICTRHMSVTSCASASERYRVGPSNVEEQQCRQEAVGYAAYRLLMPSNNKV